MAGLKNPKIGRYQSKDRALQKRLSYEKVSLTWKTANVYRYLGDETNGDGALLSDIQDPVFMENRDRRYDTNPVEINIAMEELAESPFSLDKFGIIPILGDTQIFRVHVNSFEDDGMGRYLRAGDVLEIPFLQENGNRGKKAYFEVTDTDNKMEFEKFYVTITTVPVKDTQEFEGWEPTFFAITDEQGNELLVTSEVDNFIIISEDAVGEDAGIVDLPTNSDILEDLQAQLDKAFEEEFVKEGLQAEPGLFVERGFVADDFVDPAPTVAYTDEGTRKNYNPRDPNDWLDGDGKVF
jgi:hypothetical protein